MTFVLTPSLSPAPALVLPAAGVGEGRRVTCYPSLETGFGDKYTYVADEKVVQDGQWGDGASLKWSLISLLARSRLVDVPAIAVWLW